MTAKRITLKDIACEAGVSVSAVSLALRKSPAIPEATRARIQAAAKKLGHKPDPALAALGAHRQSMKRKRVETTIAYYGHARSRCPAGVHRPSQRVSRWRAPPGRGIGIQGRALLAEARRRRWQNSQPDPAEPGHTGS